ncbi:RdgB/HAM1 family non-canonical purine NTP pyrophosphatase [Akkermansiaceae bacterium]|nr:RdgB/HAM1 family non-canonical purine NTP pyrophosphatase [Akkermansiaceae bacterium]
MKKRLIVATRNAHKVEEIREILTEYEVCDLSVVNDPPEVEETGTTFLENATLKAVAISRIVDGLVLSDDSGLEVDGLSGAPGVYSSRYAGEEGNDALNNEKLLNELSGVANRTARFRCVIVLAENGSVIAHFSGAAEGSILEEPAGAGGFGYDPLFMPKGHEESYAELGAEVKNQSSHRANALKELKDWRK